ncbi:MAG: restriction endonuclease [Aestuariivirga sp.]|nr:restriction endonuclease [Aestuariivirga sp.]
MKASRDLEILVARIQQQLAPNAEVLHDVKLDGRSSKRTRQVDVLVTQSIGQYKIQIVIECKDYAKPVDVKGVEEFYGLLSDVGAQRGVLVCPKGFSAAAKTRAADLQIDLYSPVDTDAHKWQAKPTIPALCDFRSAVMAFKLQISSPVPFEMKMDFYSKNIIHDMEGRALGTSAEIAIAKWNEGKFPLDVGEHRDLQIFDIPEVKMDNGFGVLVPVSITVRARVSRRLYFGQYPVLEMSGFKDHLSGKVLTNAFTIGLLDPEIIEKDWRLIEKEEDAPIKPVIMLQGLIGWAD